MAALPEATILGHIRQLGLARTKARHLKRLAQRWGLSSGVSCIPTGGGPSSPARPEGGQAAPLGARREQQKTPAAAGVLKQSKDRNPEYGIRNLDQPIAGAVSATGVAVAAARSSGKL
jgi:hypothetical protein